MLVAMLAALVLQVAPAQYDATFSCDCRPYSTQSAGMLKTNANSSGDFDVDYPKDGAKHLSYALRAARQVIKDSPGLQPSAKWQSNIAMLIEDQTLAVPVSVFVVQVENGIATIEARGQLSGVSVRLQAGTIPLSSDFDLIETVKLPQSADDQPSLVSVVESVNDHYQLGANGRTFDTSIKCQLTVR